MSSTMITTQKRLLQVHSRSVSLRRPTAAMSSLLSMHRSIVCIASTTTIRGSPSQSIRAISSKQPMLNSSRKFATENKDVDPKLVEIIYKMQTTPAVMKAIQEFEKLVRLKGLESQAETVRFFSFMKDTDIKEALQKIMIEMDNAGIKISTEIIQPLLYSMSKSFNGKPFK